MRIWRPDPDEPALLGWFWPLFRLSKAARDAQLAWPINVDEFDLVARVDRQRASPIWIYKHKQAGELYVDVHGFPYKFIPYMTGRQVGRFKQIEPRAAVWGAGLPDVVQPVDHDPPLVRDDVETIPELFMDPMLRDDREQRAAPRPHLRLVQ